MKLNPGDRVEMISTNSNVQLGDKGTILEESLNTILVKWDNKVAGLFECLVVSKDKVRKINNQQLEFNF
jgi:hypothetical protein